MGKDIEYLKRGDLAMIAQRTGYSRDYVCRVAKGVYRCTAVEQVLQAMIAKRKKAIEQAIAGIDDETLNFIIP